MTTLQDVAPRLAKAWRGVQREYLDGRRISEVLHHDREITICQRCRERETRDHITARMLVGPNRGGTVDWWTRTCGGSCANTSSNYRAPWLT